VLPLVHMGGLLGGQPEIARQVVVIRVDDRVYGVVVDALHGLLHTVVRPLGTLFEASEWLSGSTILPDGQIGLILDIVELVRCAEDAAGGVGR
jgi:two-component system chemotaxis sensor kinase CheA